jgi:hypothetical protein
MSLDGVRASVLFWAIVLCPLLVNFLYFSETLSSSVRRLGTPLSITEALAQKPQGIRMELQGRVA